MKKAAKKLDSLIVKTLTLVCEEAKLEIHGFAWITHFVDYKDFPASLRIICVFESQADLEHARHSGQSLDLIDTLFKALFNNNIAINAPNKTITFDTEESGASKRLLG